MYKKSLDLLGICNPILITIQKLTRLFLSNNLFYPYGSKDNINLKKLRLKAPRIVKRTVRLYLLSYLLVESRGRVLVEDMDGVQKHLNLSLICYGKIIIILPLFSSR